MPPALTKMNLTPLKFSGTHDELRGHARSEMEETLAKYSRELFEVETEVERVDDIRKRLQEKRGRIQDMIKACHGTLSPIHRVPVEVLSEIFLYCVASQDRNPSLSFTEPPLLLTGICRSWRLLAVSFPRLWASVYIPISCEPSETHNIRTDDDIEARRSTIMEARCKLLNEWFFRSGSQPLSVSIDLPSAPGNLRLEVCEEEAVDTLIRTLLPSAIRWSELKVVMPNDLFEQRFAVAIPVKCVPILQKLSLSLKFRARSDRKPIPLLDVPTLQSLSYSGIHFYSRISSLPAWNRLSSLICHSSPLRAKEALPLLQQCPCLVECEVTLYGQHDHTSEHWRSTISPATTSLLSLQSLLIFDSEIIENSTAFFNALDAPSLKWFKYGRFNSDLCIPQGVRCPPFQLFERSNVLTKFTFDPFQILSGVLVARDFFQAAKHITHLVVGPESLVQLSRRSYYDEMVSRQGMMNFNLNLLMPGDPDGGSEILLPNLEAFETIWVRGFTEGELLRFIVSRMQHISISAIRPLKCVKVLFGRAAKENSRDIIPTALKYAQDAGVDLRLELGYAF